MSRRSILEHYEGRDVLLRELDHFGWDAHVTTAPRLAAHVHPTAFEVCYISHGQVNWWVGREVYRVGMGDVFITRPGEEHGGVGAMMHTCELYFFQIGFPSRRPLPGLTLAQTRAIAAGFQRLRHRCFPGSPVVHDEFRRLLEAQRTGGVLAEIAGRAALHEILLAVLSDHGKAEAQRLGRDRDKSAPILRAMHYIDEHLAEDLRVEDIANAVQLGVSRFHERFLDEVGFSPNDYRMRRRVEVAKQWLRQGDEPITQMAMRLGFSSSQYFATVFRKHTGTTPRVYRDNA